MTLLQKNILSIDSNKLNNFQKINDFKAYIPLKFYFKEKCISENFS